MLSYCCALVMLFARTTGIRSVSILLKIHMRDMNLQKSAGNFEYREK